VPLLCPFEPKFSITSKAASALMRVEGAKQAVQHLPVTPAVLATLRETANSEICRNEHGAITPASTSLQYE